MLNELFSFIELLIRFDHSKKIKMRIAFLLLCCIATAPIWAQDKINEKAKPIIEEGIRIYQSEKASWHGTDLFLESYENKNNIGGYFSFVTDETPTCIFYAKGQEPKVIGQITFNKSFDLQTAKVNVREREMSEEEKQYYKLVITARKNVSEDSFFVSYKNTNLNVVPIISGKERNVYLLTGTSRPNVVLFGNDYLLKYDQNNKLLSKKKLHQNLIPVEYGNDEKGELITETMHSHAEATGDYITATDVCTLLLYKELTQWKMHHVVSEKLVNMYNLENETLHVITTKALEKIIDDQEQRNKK